jgi:hypothetical protein
MFMLNFEFTHWVKHLKNKHERYSLDFINQSFAFLCDLCGFDSTLFRSNSLAAPSFSSSLMLTWFCGEKRNPNCGF